MNEAALRQYVRKYINYMKRLNVVVENHKSNLLKRQRDIDTITLTTEDVSLGTMSLRATELMEDIINLFADTTIRSFRTLIEKYENEFDNIQGDYSVKTM